MDATHQICNLIISSMQMPQKYGLPFLLSLFMFLPMLSSLCSGHPHPARSMNTKSAARDVSNHTAWKGTQTPIPVRHVAHVWRSG